MSDIAIKNRQVAAGRCFVCNAMIEKELGVYRKYCLRHYIRTSLRRRGILFKPAFQRYKSVNSRVRLDRVKKRRYIIACLQSHFLAVSRGHTPPFETIRDVLFFIDNMWAELKLLHSFPLRKIKLVRLVQYIFHLDYLATKGWHHKSWVGAETNRQNHKEPKVLDETA